MERWGQAEAQVYYSPALLLEGGATAPLHYYSPSSHYSSNNLNPYPPCNAATAPLLLPPHLLQPPVGPCTTTSCYILPRPYLSVWAGACSASAGPQPAPPPAGP